MNSRMLRAAASTLVTGLICAALAAVVSVASATPVTFHYRPAIDGAKTVSVAGSFNSWNVSATPMRDGGDGLWTAAVDLAPGRYQYKFVVNRDLWFTDENADEFAPDDYGGRNSVIQVGETPMAVGTPGGDAGRDTRTGADDRDLAARVFRRAYDAYRNARNMTLEGDIHIVGGDARRRTIAFRLAQQDAGRIRVELRQPEDTTVVVSNGVTRWVYHSARGSYARGPVAGNAGLTGNPTQDFLIMLADPLPGLQRVADDPGVARHVRSEDVKAGKQRLVWDVFEVRRGPALVTYWIDQKGARVMRVGSSMAQPSADAPNVATVTVDYSRADLGTPLPDSLFVFTPPPGARPLADADIESVRGPRVTPEGVVFEWRGGGERANLAGDFNGWSMTADPMERRPDGSFRLVKRLTTGPHAYKFVINGTRWEPDPGAADSAPDGFGGFNSVVRVD